MIFAIYFVLNLKEKKLQNHRIGNTLLTAMISFSYGTTYVFDKLLKPHQQDRINVWFETDKCDPQGSLYNLIQSKMAIGSGGFSRQRFLKGNDKTQLCTRAIHRFYFYDHRRRTRIYRCDWSSASYTILHYDA